MIRYLPVIVYVAFLSFSTGLLVESHGDLSPESVINSWILVPSWLLCNAIGFIAGYKVKEATNV